MLDTTKEICTNKSGPRSEGKRVAKPFQYEKGKERCTGSCRNSLSRVCMCIVFCESTNSSKFYLAFSSCLLKRLGKDSLAVSFPRSCLDSL